MSTIVDCKNCNQEIIKDPYEYYTDPHRFNSDMCNGCYEKGVK